MIQVVAKCELSADCLPPDPARLLLTYKITMPVCQRLELSTPGSTGFRIHRKPIFFWFLKSSARCLQAAINQ